MAVNSRKASKSARAKVDYEQMFYKGVEQMIAEGKYQSTFREFVDRFAPGFPGRPKCILDDIAIRVEERLGYMIRTKCTGNSPVRVGQERGFKLVRLT